jgi:uncharacterized membrane protein
VLSSLLVAPVDWICRSGQVLPILVSVLFAQVLLILVLILCSLVFVRLAERRLGSVFICLHVDFSVKNFSAAVRFFSFAGPDFPWERAAWSQVSC